MATKMRLYSVDMDVVNTSEEISVVSSSNKLIGVTTNDIIMDTQGNEIIALSIQNFPGVFTEAFDTGEIISNFSVETMKDRKRAVIKDSVGGNWYFEISTPSKKVNMYTNNALFEFYVNPQQVVPSFEKIATPALTRGGYEIQHWGNALSSLKIDAVTGSLLSIDPATQLPRPLTQSPAYRALKKLRKLYFDDHNNRPDTQKKLLGIPYYDTFCIGYFKDFTGPIGNSEKPYIMSFSFTFTVQQIVEI